METSIIIDTSLTQEIFSNKFLEKSQDLVIIRNRVKTENRAEQEKTKRSESAAGFYKWGAWNIFLKEW